MFYQVNKSAYQIEIIGTGKSALPLDLAISQEAQKSFYRGRNG
jgi:hypothetical protein